MLDEMSQVRGAPIHYVSQGEGDPVILVHGIFASLYDWMRLAPALSAGGYRALAPDLFGHGESLKPDDPGQYTIETIYAYLEAWIDSLGLDRPAALVGHSMGGYLSLRYSLAHPERVCGLVLINPLYTLEQLSPLIRLVSRRPEFGERALRRAPEWLMNALLGWDPSKPADFSAQARRQIANDYKRASPHIVYLTRSVPDLTPALPQVKIPALVVWGDKDQTLNPESFELLAGCLANAHSHPIPGCGHQPHIGKPALVNRLALEFIASLQPALASMSISGGALTYE